MSPYVSFFMSGVFSRIRSNTMMVSCTEYPRMVRMAATVAVVTSRLLAA